MRGASKPRSQSLISPCALPSHRHAPCLAPTIHPAQPLPLYTYSFRPIRALSPRRNQLNRSIPGLFRGQYYGQATQRPPEQGADYRTLKIYYNQRSGWRSSQRGRPGATDPIRTLLLRAINQVRYVRLFCLLLISKRLRFSINNGQLSIRSIYITLKIKLNTKFLSTQEINTLYIDKGNPRTARAIRTNRSRFYYFYQSQTTRAARATRANSS